MQCKKCGAEFTPGKGLKSFCSLKCRNSQNFSEESKKLKSLKNKEFHASLTEEELVRLKDKLDKMREKRTTRFDYLFSKQFEDLAWDSKRARVIVEQELKCNRCKIDSWFGLPITLEVDHKNGNNNDDSRENLEGLCPNCHSQTPTWRGRHENNKQKNLKMIRVQKVLEEIVARDSDPAAFSSTQQHKSKK